MKIAFAGNSHLSYCTNIHPGETAKEVLENIKNHVVSVKQQFCPNKPFGVGLRLSYQACLEFAKNTDELTELCIQHNLYIFTINGFIYGHFHKKPVKKNVYLPDWTSSKRVEFSNQLATILDEMQPKNITGTISTVPIAFKDAIISEKEVEKATQHLLEHIAHLYALEKNSGKKIMLCLEPEPGCYIETIDETIEFFTKYLFSEKSKKSLQKQIGETTTFCHEYIKSHIGICYDTCHMAIEYENASKALSQLKKHQIAIGKVQISSAIRIMFAPKDQEVINYLSLFVDKIYLHQVVQRFNENIKRFTDLPEALKYLKILPRDANIEWRIHFHIPIFLKKTNIINSTQQHIIETLQYMNKFSVCQHYEVETYTWDVLPNEYKKTSLHESIVRELKWTHSEMKKLKL